MAKKKTEAQIEFKAVTSEFSSGIKDMNGDIKTLSNELKLNATQLKGNADDVDLLADRQSLLQRELQASSQKVELTNNSLKEAERLLGKNSTEYKNLYNQLLNAKNQQQAIQNELTQTSKKLEQSEQSWKDLDEAVENTNEGFTVAKGVMADLASSGIQAIISGVGSLTKSMVNFSIDSDKGLNSFIAQTGMSVESAEEFEDVMMGIYKNNFGESFEDIANAMSIVTQNIVDLDNTELQKVTENALLLRDTFEYDVNESIRAVDMLMHQFGMSSEEAFAMIVEGTQLGLNKNGDFLDSLNEYSVHYAQLGLSADEMFQSFMRGTAEGTFSVDKLGDAMKEFGIRVKDGSDSTAEAFEYLGYDADKLFATFNEGGEDAAVMTQILIDELTSMPDGIEKTTAGVALFGTMWEDLGAEVIAGIGDMNNGWEISTENLEKLNQVKYDDLGSALSGIGRNLQTSVAEPIQNNLLPLMNDFINNFDFTKLSEGINGFFEGVTNGINFLVDNKETIETIAIIVGSIGIAFGLVTTAVEIYNVVMPIYTAITTGASLSTTALGTAIAFLTSPITIAVAIIGGLIAIGVLLWKNWDTVKEKAGELKDWVVGKFTALKDGAVAKFNELKTGAINKVNELKTNAVNGFNNMKNNVVNTVTNIKDGIVDRFNSAKNTVLGIFDNIKNGITDKIQWAKDKVGGIVDKIKGLFNFEFKLPKIKLPHFGISPKGWKLGDLLQGSIPRLNIEWRKDGAIFTRPTLFNSNRGVQGIAEAGAEAVLPISLLESYINNAFYNSALQSQMYTADQTDRIIEALEKLENMGIYMDSYKVGQATANANDNINGQRVSLKERGVSFA